MANDRLATVRGRHHSDRAAEGGGVALDSLRQQNDRLRAQYRTTLQALSVFFMAEYSGPTHVAQSHDVPSSSVESACKTLVWHDVAGAGRHKPAAARGAQRAACCQSDGD